MIKIHWNLEQGTPEWKEARKHKISATDTYDILNGVSITDILNRKQNDTFSGSEATERGHILEDEARQIYSELTKQEVLQAGGIENSEYPNCWFSPDGIVNEDGLVEIKCFEKTHHEATIKSLDAHLIAQIQFQLLISKRDYTDFVAYCPEEEDPQKAFKIIRVLPDTEIQNKLKTLLLEDQTSPDIIEETGLQIINLQQELQRWEDQLSDYLDGYQKAKDSLEKAKEKLKQQTTGKISTSVKLGDNTLSISIYDSDRITCTDPSLVPKEYTSKQELKNAFVEQGRIYERVPNTTLIKNYYKAGKSLPKGFTNKPSRSIRLNFNGKAI